MARTISINGGPYEPRRHGGLVRYIEGVLDELLPLERGATVITGSPAVRRRYEDRTRVAAVPWFSDGGFRGNLARLGWSVAGLPRMVTRMGAEVHYSPVPEGMLHPTCPQVITVHDLIPLHFPEANPRLVHYYRHVLPRMLRASSAVVAVSEATASDLRDWLPDADLRIEVVHQGYRRQIFRPRSDAEVAAVRARHGLGDYVLAVGEARPYKNLDRLIRAVARMREPGLTLAIVGAVGGRSAGLLELPAQLGVADRVRFLGSVADDELAALYSGARALVFPSLYEGFGIPLVEAMACGCPVAASRAASIPEICQDAAVYFDPRDVDAIAAAVERTASDEGLRQGLRDAGLRRAAAFCHARAAGRVSSIINSCI